MSDAHSFHHRDCLVAAIALVTFIPGGAGAMCLPATDAERLAAADAVFEGFVVRGPASPARLKVLRYIKGDGPKELSVETGSSRNRDGTMTSTSVGIRPLPGETWLIYGLGSRNGAVITSSCAGSRRLSAQSPPSPADGKD
ncbi:MAG TPA: hypothetical protein VGP71_13005 [Burkholderiales bacterium]|jgi:hypothetical protein|nr:hypothetical protein [Burkholderiales bacterium]